MWQWKDQKKSELTLLFVLFTCFFRKGPLKDGCHTAGTLWLGSQKDVPEERSKYVIKIAIRRPQGVGMPRQ